MRKLLSLISIAFIIVACSPVKIAVDDTNWLQKEELPVKGRQGFLIKQKLSFGEFKTSTVKRSWTKGSSWAFGIPLGNDWVESLNIEWVRRKQTVRFNLMDEKGNESEVTAFSKVKWRDLTIGNDPNSIVNIIGDIMKIGDEGTNTYAVRIFPSKNEHPWEMLIDNNASQANAKTYTGLLAKNKSEYYVVAPVYKLMNKQGKAISLPLGGSVGFEFRDKNGNTVAAVSLIDNGVVYFNKVTPQEKFLLANAAAALLLQQELDEAA
jgi:hypothetical protein